MRSLNNQNSRELAAIEMEVVRILIYNMIKRQHPNLIIVLLLINTQVLGQKSNIVFEQKALDYFADSILNKTNPFMNFVAHFDGMVDEGITSIEYEMTRKYPDDKELMDEYRKSEKATAEFWEKNSKPPFPITVKEPVKSKLKKHYENKNKAIRLMVFQSKNVGLRNYVWIRAFIKDGSKGYDLYFTLDHNGKIINWYYVDFIF